MTIANGYLTGLQAANALFKGSTTITATESASIDMVVEAASRQIDEACNRRFYADTSTSSRVYAADAYQFVNVDDISTASSVEVATDDTNSGAFSTLWAAGDYQLEPANALVRGRPITRIRGVGMLTFPQATVGSLRFGTNIIATGEETYGEGLHLVQVTAKWGWPAVPSPIVQATLVQAAMLWESPDAPFGVAGASDVGEMRITSYLHPVASALIRPYRRGQGGLV